jgi:2',3'-cyclic-nucleotide 2'-phosphodiesterase/3'-nucleotidase
MILKRLWLALLFLFIFGFSSAQKEINLKVIGTSDVHGAFFPFDFINNKAVDFGLAQVYSYVQLQRANPNQEVLLFDNGDILQGQPTVYFANYIDSSEHHLVAQLMNFMGYNAASIGNHDVEAGPEIYDRLSQQFEFPWLSANILDTRTGKTYFKPYHVFDVNGLRIAVMGLTTPGVPRWLPKKLWPNMEFTDMIEAAQMWMDSIQIKEKPHVVIGLFHAGHNANYEGSDPDLPLNENASLLVAKRVKGFDAILIGHDHDRTVKNVINLAGETVVILDPGSNAHMVSDLTIKVKLSDNGKVISKKVEGNLISMRDQIPNHEYVSFFNDFSTNVAEFVDRRIGTFQSEVSTRDSYFGPSAFVGLIHSVQLGISNADISFAAPLSFDARIEQGPVFVRDMFKLYSYENLLYIMNLTGKEVKDYLEYSCGLWFNTMESKSDNLILFRKDENGLIVINGRGRGMLKSSFFNFDAAAGIMYQVDVTKPIGTRINIISMEDGSQFSDTITYRVAINSYRGTGGGGHLTLGAGIPFDELRDRVVSVSQMDMRHYLIKWIEHVGKVAPVIPQNWELIPADWTRNASQTDRIILFGNGQEIVY